MTNSPLIISPNENSKPVATIFGVPFDSTHSYKPGCRFGPDSIRDAFNNIEIFQPEFGVDLEVEAISDLGNTRHTVVAAEMLQMVKNVTSELKKRRDFVVKRLNSMSGISCSNPNGAFYAFPKIENNQFKSDKEFVLELLKQKNVLAVHGSGFGTKYGSDHFRIVYLPNMEILESAMNKIEDFVR